MPQLQRQRTDRQLLGRAEALGCFQFDMLSSLGCVFAQVLPTSSLPSTSSTSKLRWGLLTRRWWKGVC